MDVDHSTNASRLTRLSTTYDPLEPLANSFLIEKSKNSEAGGSNNAFRNQYASVYFSRLMALKKVVKGNAEMKWKDVVRKNPQSGKSARVLDIKPGSLCIVIGTIYMEMRLKPNILEDIAREQYIAVPPPRPKFLSDDDEVMLEDESGRVRLVGKVVEERKFPLVTGVIAAVLGAENQSGDFEVADMCFAGIAPQSSEIKTQKGMATKADGDEESDPYVALVSGLELGLSEDSLDYRIGLLAEWLTGEAGSDDVDKTQAKLLHILIHRIKDRKRARQVVRLVIAGNSMTQPARVSLADSNTTTDKKPRKTYGYDSSSFSSTPTAQLDNFLGDVLPSLDVDLMSGAKDPNGTTLPQQPLHEALLPRAASFSGFKRSTNPCWFEIANRSFLGTSGQNLDDIFKYLESDDRISMACSTLEWSHMAPTAPDTLCKHTFFTATYCAYIW
ncbi:MAG: hypothetical protein CYPHOPRED_001242 [Cyphobasidiales sp. Tagirdzhanova-0007]|nr:MAG: hypothetical protein CYPHOPRED_001242 [Cyphobasidiales sp. Tagirdzhanova-0007]